MRSPLPSPWIRRIVFVLVAAAIVFPPFRHQVLDLRANPWLRTWRMYYGYGVDICEVEYVRIKRSGEAVGLNRYEVLDYPRWYDAPTDVRNLPDGPAIGRVARQMCDRFPGTRTDIRAKARCGSRRGWVAFMDREVNLCALSAQERDQLRPRRRNR